MKRATAAVTTSRGRKAPIMAGHKREGKKRKQARRAKKQLGVCARAGTSAAKTGREAIKARCLKLLDATRQGPGYPSF